MTTSADESKIISPVVAISKPASAVRIVAFVVRPPVPSRLRRPLDATVKSVPSPEITSPASPNMTAFCPAFKAYVMFVAEASMASTIIPAPPGSANKIPSVTATVASGLSM